MFWIPRQCTSSPAYIVNIHLRITIEGKVWVEWEGFRGLYTVQTLKLE